MIDRVAGWSWAIRDRGIVLTSDVGHIRYQEQLRPLRPARAIVAGLEPPPGWSAAGELVLERLATHEQEHAALATVAGSIGGQPARRVVGVVLLDDSYALVDGVAQGAAHLDALAATVRALAVGDTHMLGERRRRFVYVPPPWNGLLVPPHHAYWLSPGYPRDGVYAIVFPAQPRTAFLGDARAVVAALVRNEGWEHEAAALVGKAINTPNGLAGQLFEAVVGDAVRVFVVLEGQRYLYPMMLETPRARLAEVLPAFKVMVESVEPLTGEGSAPAVEHWAE